MYSALLNAAASQRYPKSFLVGHPEKATAQENKYKYNWITLKRLIC